MRFLIKLIEREGYPLFELAFHPKIQPREVKTFFYSLKLKL